MHCPNCGFVSFDDLDQCKKCGFDFEAHRKGGSAAKSSWFQRLRSGGDKAPAAKRPSRVTRREVSPPQRSPISSGQLRNQDEHLQRERSRLARQYSGAEQTDRLEIRTKLDELDRERAKLRHRIDSFEREQRARESTIREQLEAERQTAEREREKTRELRSEMETKLREAEQARLQAQAELEQAKEQRRQIQDELQSAREDQGEIESELANARGSREQLARELEQAREQAALKAAAAEEIKAKAEALAAQQAEVKRLEDERRLLAEAARSLQEERERLEQERLQREKIRRLEERAQEETPAEKPAPLTKPAALRETPAPTEIQRPEPLPKPTPPARPTRVAARAEDLLELYSRPRDQQEQEWEPRMPVEEVDEGLSAAVSAELPLDDEDDDDRDVEEILYEIEEEKEPRSKIPPKGGLLFRSLAAAIDVALLVAVVAVFLVIGFFVSGASGGGVLPVLGLLGLPFYIVFLMLAAAYFTYMHGVYGQTLGKRVLGLRVMTTHGDDLGYLNAFFRFVTTCFSVGLMGMGVFWMALDPNKQAWHDKLSRTVVVRL